MEYHPALGDRVKLSRDLGGHLKEGRLGIVVEIDPPNEDGSMPSLPVHLSVPWIREEAPCDSLPWLGKMGKQSVTLIQFYKAPVIPVGLDEIDFVDNPFTAQRG